MKIVFNFLFFVHSFIVLFPFSATNAQCPGYNDLLNHGWSANAGDPHHPGSFQNEDEFGIYDTEQFLVKVDNYPPIRSFPKIYDACGPDPIHYMSFDVDAQNTPIPYNVTHDLWHSVNIFRLDGTGYSVWVKPPTMDFVMNFNTTEYDLSWDPNVYPEWEWNDFVILPTQTGFSFHGMLVGPSELVSGQTEEFIANIYGGGGDYRFTWDFRSLVNGVWGDWIFIKKDEHAVNYFTFYTNEYDKYYFYDYEYKCSRTMQTNQIELRCTVFDYYSQLEIMLYKTITPAPVEIAFINEIANTTSYGELILDEDKNDPIQSGIPKPMNYSSDWHTIRTNELPFIYDYNSTGKTEKHQLWDFNPPQFVLNHQFQVDQDIPIEMRSKFNGTSPISVQNILEGFVVPGGNVKLRDPWYYYKDTNDNWFQSDVFKTYSSPFTIENNSSTSYGGIFLDQLISSGNYYSVKVDEEQTIPINGVNHKFYFQNWSGTDAQFQYPNALETGVVFTDGSAEVNAVLKGVQVSDYSGAYNNNGQRKFVRTDDGYLHHVYESMGKVFYELSSDGGANWQIINMPGWEGETPSIDYFQNFVVVAVQYDAFPGIPSVELISFKKSGSTYIQAGLQTVEVLTSSAKIPVIAIRKGDGYPYEPSRFLVIWKDNTYQQAGLYAVAGNLLSDGNLELLGQYPVTFITGTNASSSNPTVASSKIYASLFQLAWQQNTAGTNSKINYCTIGVSSDPAITVYAIQNISLGNGFGQNITPSIIEYPYNSQSIAKITWVGIRQVDDNPVTEYKTFYRSLESGTFKSFGDVARFPVINKTNNNNAFAISWNESNSNTNKFTPSWKSLRYIYPLNVDGKAVQLNNGSSYNGSSNSSGMFGMVFSESTTPYTFSKSLDLASLTPPDKITSNSIALGREGVIYKDSAQFYFAMGDIILNNQTIDFVDLPDTVFIVDNQMLNQYLYSIPFEVNDNSILYYTVQYGISDSASAVNVLHLNDYLSFKVELIDDLSGEALGQYDDITFTKTNVAQYDNISYKVNTEGIGNRYVRLRLTTSNNFNPSYSVTQRFADESVLGKSSLQEVNYKGSLGVDSYDLAQNYPNPFNPSTTIKYQIPNAGNVSLKIYDILGREVTTLVDEFKSEGRYEVNFNASNLASGVYIYTIKSNDFTASKKLMLLK